MSLNGSDRGRLGASLSPSALAELSRYLALQSYLPKNGGLFGSGWAQFMAGRAAPQASAAANPLQAVRQPPSALRAISTNRASSSSYRPAALSLPSRLPIPVPGCASCHGPRQPPVTPPSAPPRPPGADDPWTYYPDISRRDGGGWGTSPSRSGDDHPQCEIQERRDNTICKRQVSPDPDDTPRVRAVCHASRMDRYEHCLKTGEIRYPQLQTTKVQQGEPPIPRWRKPR
jgi:mono/diheme cytochrome c family protein